MRLFKHNHRYREIDIWGAQCFTNDSFRAENITIPCCRCGEKTTYDKLLAEASYRQLWKRSVGNWEGPNVSGISARRVTPC